MRTVLLFALLASVTAFEEFQQSYHDTVGIPLATEIKAYEDGLVKTPQVQQERIVGGALAPAGAQPFFGGLLISLLNTAGQSVCGSSLLSPTRAITAAHCWFDGVRQATMFTVIFNSNFLFSGGTRVTTNHIVMHPQWNFRNLHNDVAIIYLPFWLQTSASIQPISIPSAFEVQESFAGHWALAIGFGRTSDSQQSAATVLSRVNLQVINNNQCQSVFGPAIIIHSTLCTNGAGGVGICGGDSGGPLVVNFNGRPVLDLDMEYRVNYIQYFCRKGFEVANTTDTQTQIPKMVGVSSFVASAGCQLGFPSAFARVTSFRNFIVQHM